MRRTHFRRRDRLTLWGGSILLAGCLGALGLVAHQIARHPSQPAQLSLLYCFLLILAGAAYLVSVAIWRRQTLSRSQLGTMLLLGATLRLVFFFFPPALEDDYHRYLWDGAVTAAGENPYRYAPTEVLRSAPRDAPVFSRLGAAASEVLPQINHPHLRTIYPPVTQAVFALAHLLKPWDLTAWRSILLAADILALVILGGILRHLGRSLGELVLYWWNPILIVVTYNALHMDVLLVPALMGACWLALNSRWSAAVAFVLLAAGIKLWPLLLLPLFIRPIIKDARALGSACLLMVAFTAVLWASGFLQNLDANSGLVAYGRSWENNASAFRVLLWALQQLYSLVGIHAGHAQAAVRVLIGLILIAMALVFAAKPITAANVLTPSLVLTAALFLLSPTQFPWYFVWLLPFLTLRPVAALLWLSALLPLYYSRYYFEPHQRLDVFEGVVVWVQFVPVWIGLLITFFTGGNRNRCRTDLQSGVGDAR